jgi:hypothetical protein
MKMKGQAQMKRRRMMRYVTRLAFFSPASR